MKRIILFLFFVLSISTGFGQSAFKKDLRNVVEISFPVPASFKIVGTDTVYYARQYSSYYFALSKDFSGDPNFTVEKDSLDSFYEGVIRGTVATAKGALIKQNFFLINGLRGVEFEFVSTDNPHLPNLRFQRSLYLNKKLVNYSYWTVSDSLGINASKKDQFFNSISIKADKNNLKQYTESKDLLTKIQRAVGSTVPLVISAVMLICSVVLIILLIKRRNKNIRKFRKR